MPFCYIIQTQNVGQNSVAKLFHNQKLCMSHSFKHECQADKQLAFFIFNFSEWNSRFFSLRPSEIYERFFFSIVFREESTCIKKTPRHLSFYRVRPLAGIEYEPKILGVLRNCGIRVHVVKEQRLSTNILFSLTEHFFFCVLQKTQIIKLFRCQQFL